MIPGPGLDELRAPAELTEDVQTFIVQRLACFDPPSKVADAVKELCGLEVNRQTVQHYDPTKGEKPAEKWCTLFEATRKAFIESVAQIGIAHKTYRLAVLQRGLETAEKRGNWMLVKDLLRQAAEEMGEVYTNHRTMKLDGQVQGGVLMVPTPVTAPEWATAAAAQQASLPGSGGGSRESLN